MRMSMARSRKRMTFLMKNDDYPDDDDGKLVWTICNKGDKDGNNLHAEFGVMSAGVYHRAVKEGIINLEIRRLHLGIAR